MKVPTVCAAGAAIFMVLGFTVTADAAKSKKSKKSKASDVVTVDGCAQFVLPFCVGVTSGNATYIVNSALPPILPGTAVTVVGQQAGDVSPCFGTWLRVISWKLNKNPVCVLR